MLDDFITQLYRNILGREPDAAGLAYWNSEIQNGSLDAISLTRTFLESAEHQTIYKSIALIYYAALNRISDEAGLEYWAKDIRNGAAIGTIATSIIAADEFKTLYGQRSNEQFLTDLYDSALLRAPDAQGLAYWGRLLELGTGRGALIQLIATSPEMLQTRSMEVDYVLLYRGIFGELPTQDKVGAALPITNLNALIKALYKSPEYSGVDVPGVKRYVGLTPKPEPVPELEFEPEPDPGPPPDTTAPTILAFTVSSATTLALKSSESGSAGLYSAIGDELIPGSTSVLFAETTTDLTVYSPSDEVITARLQVFDTSGNSTFSPTRIYLGTESDDTITGTEADDFMFGFGGDDIISGDQGNDEINAGAGDNVVMDAGVGFDGLIHDTLGATVAIAVTGSDFVWIESTQAGVTVTIADGINGHVNAGFSTAAIAFLGGNGHDTINGGNGSDTIDGGNGNDVIDAEGGTNEINNVGVGSDYIYHRVLGATVAIGVTGSDLVLLEATDTGATVTIAHSVSASVNAFLSTAAISIEGGNGNDWFRGGGSSDTINGGAGNDTIITGAGNDVINAGAGINRITDLGDGSDTVIHNVSGSTVSVEVINTGEVMLDASVTGATVTVMNLSNASVDASGSIAAIVANGNIGNDTITGGSGNDVISGGAGNDVITGGRGRDSLTGGEGVDTFIFNSTFGGRSDSNILGSDQITDLSASDYILLRMSEISLFDVGVSVVAGTFLGSSYSALLGNINVRTPGSGLTTAQARAMTILDVSLSDIGGIVIGGINNDTITGGARTDSMNGGAGDDLITGGAGDDSITGGAGADVLTGGNGADTFVYDAGATGIALATADTITDFTTGSDVIETGLMGADVNITDGGALNIDTFSTAASTWFASVLNEAGVFVAFNAAGTGDAWVAINNNGGGTLTDGDSLVVLNGIDLMSEINALDFIFFMPG